MHSKQIRIAVADDHQLFLNSLALMINSFENFTVDIEAINGKQYLERIKENQGNIDIALLDVKMPVMDGIEVTKFLSEKFPLIKIVALSMNDDDQTIISMIRAGACAYLLKDMHPTELEKALLQIFTKGYYNSDCTNINYRRLLTTEKDIMNVTDRERRFLKLASSDLTYKQIAKEMNLSERTIDGYRESLFGKFKVQSRVGMVMEALRKNLIEM